MSHEGQDEESEGKTKKKNAQGKERGQDEKEKRAGQGARERATLGARARGIQAMLTETYPVRFHGIRPTPS